MLCKLLLLSSFFSSCWALSCSAPETLSDPRFDASGASVSLNEQMAFVSWVSADHHRMRLEMAQKVKDCSWSSPEWVSNWASRIFPNQCFVNQEGAGCITWEALKEDQWRLQISEKRAGESWSDEVSWNPLSTDFQFGDAAYDRDGKLVWIGVFSETYPLRINLFSKAAGQVVERREEYALDYVHWVSDFKIRMTAKGVGYAFWVSSQSGKSLVCQKIVNGQFVGPAEVIGSSESFLDEIEIAINEQEDIAVAYEDEVGAKLLVRTNQSWSLPVSGQSGCVKISIDHSGNVMAVLQVERDQQSMVQAMYKPLGQDWQDPVFFSAKDADDWYPSVQSDQKGDFVVIWQRQKKRRNSIFGASFSTANGMWSQPQQLSPQGECCYWYAYAFGSPGKGYIAWTMSPNGYEEVVQVATLSNE